MDGLLGALATNVHSYVHSTQREAISAAREAAIRQGSEMLIHGKNGRIRERSTYGNDPHPPKG